MNEEDALNYMIDLLRDPKNIESPGKDYEIDLRRVIEVYLTRPEGMDPGEMDRQVLELSPQFYAAAWELCRRGIIRPGVRNIQASASLAGCGGQCYSSTPFGRRWHAEIDRHAFIPTEPGRFAELLKPFHVRFGPGFSERAQEAHRCYSALAYLACCAMCGAAAESVLLALATKKRDEQEVLRDYASAGGRGRVESLVLEKAEERLKKEFRSYSSLLKYWRDEASHGRPSGIGEIEAFTSLQSLLRLAQCANNHWEELTDDRGSPPQAAD